MNGLITRTRASFDCANRLIATCLGVLALAAALATALALTTALAPAPAYAGQRGPFYGAGDDESYIWFTKNDKEDSEIFDAYAPDVQSEYPGLTYDRNTNTLTMENVNADRTLYITAMGESFKLNVVGTNNIEEIRVDGDQWGGSLEIVGTGKLTVNASKYNGIGIVVDGGAYYDSTADKYFPTSTNACLRVASGVDLTVYSGDELDPEAIAVNNTGIAKASDAIVIDGALAEPLALIRGHGGLEWEDREAKVDYFIDSSNPEPITYSYTCTKPGSSEQYVAVKYSDYSSTHAVYRVERNITDFGYPILFPLPEYDSISPTDDEWGDFTFTPSIFSQTFIVAEPNYSKSNEYTDGNLTSSITTYNTTGPLCVKNGVNPYSTDAEYYLAKPNSTYEFISGELKETITNYDMYKITSNTSRTEANDWYGEGPVPAGDFGYLIEALYAEPVPAPGNQVSVASGGGPEGYTVLRHADYDPCIMYRTTNSVIKRKPAAPVAGIAVGASATVGGVAYQATGANTVVFTKAPNKKKVTVPNKVKINGKSYAVVGIAPKAFAKAKKCKTVTLKAKGLTKKSVKNCFKKSKVKKVKFSKIPKKTKKKYRKWFKSKKVVGKKVAVK